MNNSDISSSWTSKRLGELSSSIQYGYTAKAQHENVGPKLLRITDIQDGAVDWDNVPTCRIGDTEKNKYLLSKGDLVFARTGATVGKSYLINGAIPEAVFASYLIRVRLREEIDPKYVSYFFKSPEYWRQISENQAGIGQPNVNGKKLSQLLVPVAPPNQQKRIVAEIEKQFSRLDEAVANLKRVKANLKRYKAAVLKAAVEGKLTEEWRKQHPDVEPASELLKRILAQRRAKWSGKGKYKEPAALNTAALPSLPEGWIWTTLDSLLREPLRNGHSAKASGTGSGLRAFTLSAVTDDDFSERNTKLTVADPAKVTDLWAEPGDIYVERSNTPELVGIARLYAGPSRFAFIPDLLIRVRLLPRVSARFVELCLLSERGRNYFRSRAQGISGSMPKIDQSVIETAPIPIPPIAEQEEIVTEMEQRLSVVGELEATVSANFRRAERLRQTILQRAFAGKLVSKNTIGY